MCMFSVCVSVSVYNVCQCVSLGIIEFLTLLNQPTGSTAAPLVDVGWVKVRVNELQTKFIL